MNEQDNSDIDWAAIVDLLASEYGWTIEYIKSLDLGQVVALKARIQRRYDHQNGQVSQDMGTVPGESELTLSDFETKLGGIKRVREDGITEIII